MKSKSIILFPILITAIWVSSCSMSSEELAYEVMENMKEEAAIKDNDIIIKDLILTKKSGNVYDGILETTEPNGEFTYSVEVVYDGDNFTWKIIE